MIEKKIGKIQSVKFGHGGYQDAMLGISFTLGSDAESWGVGDQRCEWDPHLIACTEHCKWTESDRSRHFDEVMRYISNLMHDAKVSDIAALKGKPVEVTFEGMTLKEWRILTEAI